jgi:CBS domain-containing protein
MQVQEVMCRTCKIIDPETTIREVARRMREEDIGALPVGENDRLVGMITDRDIVIRGIAGQKGPANPKVRDVMSAQIFYCFEDDDVEKAATMMAEHQVRRLPVLNRNKRLVGVLALADLGQKAADAAKTALKGVSKPSKRPHH